MPHPPTRACEADHCHFHHEDEPAGASAIVCGECGHAYLDTQNLREAMALRDREVGLPMRVIEDDELIVCPFCGHYL